MIRNYTFQFRFPQALVRNADQTVRVVATSFPAAAGKAVREVFKREGIKGKKSIRTFTMGGFKEDKPEIGENE